MSLPPSLGHLRDVKVDFRFYNWSADQWLDDVCEKCIARHLVKLPSGFLEYGPSFSGENLRHPLHLRSIIVTLVRVSARPPRDNDEIPRGAQSATIRASRTLVLRCSWVIYKTAAFFLKEPTCSSFAATG